MERWSGKVAVVTGASSGIGKSISLELAKHGMKVVALGRRKENLDKLVDESKNLKGTIASFKCDVRNREDVKSAFEFTCKKFGPVSVLINNAGVGEQVPLTEMQLDAAVKIIETNVIGVINCLMEATTIMKNSGIDDGHIININSVAGHRIVNYKGIGVYTASKHAVTALTECLKNDLSHDKSNIKVTSISPGMVETEMSAGMLKNAPNTPMLKDIDVANSIIYALETPKHVNICEITLRSVQQPNYN